MHPHPNRSAERRFIIAIGLTFLILVAEIIGGYWTGSLALLSDAAHVFSDLFALGLSYLALRLSALAPDDKHSYGWHRLEVFAALINGITLVLISIGILREAWMRWQEPPEILGPEMLLISVIGLVVNVAVIFVLGWQSHTHNGEASHTHSHRDLNLQSAFLHVVGDTLSSVGVITAAILIWQFGWLWADPIASVLIAALIMVSAVRVLRSAIHILVEGVPEGLSSKEIANEMASIPGVQSIHDLHVWSICSTHISLSAHVVVESDFWQESSKVMAEIKEHLTAGYGIQHSTLQFEQAACQENCD